MQPTLGQGLKQIEDKHQRLDIEGAHCPRATPQNGGGHANQGEQNDPESRLANGDEAKPMGLINLRASISAASVLNAEQCVITLKGRPTLIITSTKGSQHSQTLPSNATPCNKATPDQWEVLGCQDGQGREAKQVPRNQQGTSAT
tara:strand:+ start:2959 stop:3393 length:435 start_codon:yes stop_codon:yes gene_type:complete